MLAGGRGDDSTVSVAADVAAAKARADDRLERERATWRARDAAALERERKKLEA